MSRFFAPDTLVGDIELNIQELCVDLENNNVFDVSIENGARGESAYEVWLKEGHTGSREDFIEFLRANTYVHPETHSANMITETEEKQFLTGYEKNIVLTTCIHEQIASSNEWTVIHNLNKYPSVTIVDTVNNIVVGSVQYVSKNILVVKFTAEFSGKVYLN